MPLVRIVFSPAQDSAPEPNSGALSSFTTKDRLFGGTGQQRLTGQRTAGGRRTRRRTLTAGSTGQIGEHSTGYRSTNRPERNDRRTGRNRRRQWSARARRNRSTSRNRSTGRYWRTGRNRSTGGHWGTGSYRRTGHFGEWSTRRHARRRAAGDCRCSDFARGPLHARVAACLQRSGCHIRAQRYRGAA
jgi:hypothetical protein